jgi:small subunit ribosomal protein S16
MAVRIRLSRFGKNNRPHFRVCAMDSRRPRDGKILEILGQYDPYQKDRKSSVKLDADRIRYWLSVGAQPTGTVAAFLRWHKIEKPAPAKAPAGGGAKK